MFRLRWPAALPALAACFALAAAPANRTSAPPPPIPPAGPIPSPSPASSSPASASPLPARDAILHGKYLDCHCHTAGIGSGGSGCYIGKGLRESWKLPLYLKAFGVTRKELEDSGDALVMKRISRRLAGSRTVGAAVILALDGAIDSAGNLDTARTELHVPNAFVAAEVRKYPNLLFGASVNPRRRDALARLEVAKAQGAVLIKWLPSIMLFDPADSAFIPFYLKMKSLGLPLLTHTGEEGSFHAAEDTFGDPRRLELPLKLGVIVIAAHVATRGKSQGQDNCDRLLSMLPAYPNLYADVSTLTQINKIGSMKKIMPLPEVEGRLIYGTDFPLIETLVVSPWYFLFRAPFKDLRAVAAVENPWDQDVALKKALGMPEDIFARSDTLLLLRNLPVTGF